METINLILIISAILIVLYFLIRVGWKKVKRWILKKLLLKKIIEYLEKFVKKHPYIFWTLISLYIIIPEPIPIIDDLTILIIALWLTFKKPKRKKRRNRK